MEVIGHPEQHVNDVSLKVLEQLKKEDGITIINSNVNKAELVKENIFASHIEAELKVVGMLKLLTFCYDYLPSSLEVVDSEKIVMPVREVNAALSEMLRKLHGYNLMLHNLAETNKELLEKTKSVQDPKENNIKEQ